MHSTVQNLVDEAMIELPGCPRPIVAIALRDVVNDFQGRAQVATAELDAIDIVAATTLYTLALPAGFTGWKIGVPVLVVQDDYELRAGIDWRMQSRTSFQLNDEPSAASEDGLEITVALALDDIQTASLALLEDWYATLVAGVKSRLMLMRAKPWTDLQTAMAYRSEYNDGLSQAMSSVACDGLNEPMRLRM